LPAGPFSREAEKISLPLEVPEKNLMIKMELGSGK
jgi:hypothetical protein